MIRHFISVAAMTTTLLVPAALSAETRHLARSGDWSASGGSSAMQLLAMSPEKIEVQDRRGRPSARFSSHGFAPMLDRVVRCAQ